MDRLRRRGNRIVSAMQEQPDTTQPAEDPIGDTRSARWCSAALVIVAGTALVANCLLNCPRGFSPAHKADTSLLRALENAVAQMEARTDGKAPSRE